MSKYFILNLFILISYFQVSPSYAGEPKINNKIDQLLTDTFPKRQPGAVVLVAKSGKVIFHKAYGMANVEMQIPLTTDMHFRIASLTKQDLIVCPTDYPYLYSKADKTRIFLGENRHWRQIDQTLCTFLTSKNIVQKHWNELISMCKFEHYPFEKPLHNIYEKELCISPMPSLAVHFTNINSVYGLSPNVNWKRLWDENEI